MALPALAAPAAAATDYSSTIAALQREIPAILERTGTVGATVALVDSDRVVFAQGFGFADRERGVPVSDRTLFHIGSVSKTFAATAVMQLVERGLVDLDAPLGRYVPAFRLDDPALTRRITVRSVLTHHSGIPGDVFNGGFTQGRPVPGYERQVLRWLRAMPPERAVDTEWAYNNSGYLLLRAVIENVTGMGLEAYAQRNLFGPMGMRTAHFDDRIPADGELTRNYELRPVPGGGVAAALRPREYVNVSTAGSIVASGRDMTGYLRMILAEGRGVRGRVLAARTLRRMWTPQTRLAIDAASPVTRMGLGWFLVDPYLAWTGTVRWHDGGTTWNFSQLKVIPAQGLGVFVSVNTGGGADTAVANAVLGRAFAAKTGRPVPTAPGLPAAAPATVPRADLGRLAGRYAGVSDLDRVDVSGDGAGLVWRRAVGTPREQAATFRPGADGWYRSAEEGTELRFRTVSGRRLLVTRNVLGDRAWTFPRALRVPAWTVPAAWRARLGAYRPVNANPDATPVDRGSVRRVTLAVAQGVLVLDVDGESRQVLRPAGDERALTFGIGAQLGRGKGQVVQAVRTGGGRVMIDYMGLRLVRIDDEAGS
ncbi:MAG: beta-lactamase family protein [Thermoleophilia bacterium]|nr:beta-lactamase family protein [Thermoleophilia bacterium]